MSKIRKKRWIQSVVIAVLLLMMFVEASQCLQPWKKYWGNPVLGNDELGTCFDVDVVEDDKGKYQMYFSWRPMESIAISESSDGINWSEPEIVLEPDKENGWENIVNRSSVVTRDGKSYLWYTGQNDTESAIGLAVSENGQPFERISNLPVLTAEYEWEGISVMNPCVIWDEQEHIFKMWYSAGEKSEPDVIGYAWSEDGISWEKMSEPIFTPTDRWYEKAKIGGCDVVKTEDGYLMFYIGYEDKSTARICVAWSADGQSEWKESKNNPIVSPDTGEWDAIRVISPVSYGTNKRKNGCCGTMEDAHGKNISVWQSIKDMI